MKFFKILFLLIAIGSFGSLRAQKVGLVLSGGGAKGFAHVGVIRALEENNVPINYITGTSMGAIVGALYAIGYSPDEMEALFSSPEFYSWYTGSNVEDFANYSQKMDEGAGILSLRFDFNKKGVKMQLPMNIISPFQMDLAFLKLFAASSAAAGENFDNLFVPFRCVSTDINSKKAYVSRSGDLGTAVRASMTLPLVFRAVVLDTMLLFDGGIHNNFPQDVMIKDFNPDFIIGSKCSDNTARAEEDDIIMQIANILMRNTDYEINPDNGVSIESKFSNITLLDFNKLNEIIQIGYENTLAQMPAIKERVKSHRLPNELTEMRAEYKKSLPELRFKGVSAYGKINEHQARYISRIIRENSNREFDFGQLQKAYYRFLGTGAASIFYPTPSYDSTYGLFNVSFRTVPSPRFKFSIGGNISSSNAQLGYVGLEFRYWERWMTRAVGNLYYGRLYGSGLVGFRQDIPSRRSFFYEAFGIYNRFDYYSGSPDIFVASLKPSYLKESDYHFRAAAGFALNSNTPLRVGFTTGQNVSEYYQTVDFKANDITDKSRFRYENVFLRIDRNTHNSSQFPTGGRSWFVAARYMSLTENYRPGSTSLLLNMDRDSHRIWAVRLFNEKYHKFGSRLSVGYLVDVVYSTKAPFSNYFSTLLMAPAFLPSIHSKTIFIDRLRADSYLGLGIMPSVFFTKNVFLKTGIFAFQPYRQFVRMDDNTVAYGEPFRNRMWMANANIVWDTPIGPLSISTNYYAKQDTKFYFVFNFGFILFNRSGTEY